MAKKALGVGAKVGMNALMAAGPVGMGVGLGLKGANMLRKTEMGQKVQGAAMKKASAFGSRIKSRFKRGGGRRRTRRKRRIRRKRKTFRKRKKTRFGSRRRKKRRRRRKSRRMKN